MAAPRTVYWYEESARLTRGAAFIGQVCHAMLGLYRGGAVKLTMPYRIPTTCHEKIQRTHAC
jgi:hypothetical protein